MPTDETALLQQIQSSLDATGVWIDPSLRALFTKKDVATIEANIARSDQPQFVVVYPFTDGDPFNDEPEELLTVLHDASQVDGLYLSARSPENGDPTADYASVGLVGRLWGPGPDAQYVTSPAEDHHPGDISGALVEATRTVADGTAQQAWDAYIDALPQSGSDTSSSAGSSSSSQDTGDSRDAGDAGSGVGVGAVVGVVVALAAVAAVWRVRRARRRTFSLPASVIANVREAHDDLLEEQAGAEVLALGEAIDATDMAAGDEQTAWQAALDHYDAAKRVLARGGGEPEVLDVVGAIVLARRGESALASAKQRRPFTPAPLCYLNPLHAAPRGSSRVETGGRRVEVPLCAACQRDLKTGRAPDVLDVERRGRAVHYFDTDAEPWASTGYGTLKPDLVERLHGRRT